MTRSGHKLHLPKEQATQGLALLLLLFLGGMAIAGPSGVLAWSENLQLLDQRKGQIVELRAEKARLENLNALLHPDHADPDLVGELIRGRQNMMHPDEMVMILTPEGN